MAVLEMFKLEHLLSDCPLPPRILQIYTQKSRLAISYLAQLCIESILVDSYYTYSKIF